MTATLQFTGSADIGMRKLSIADTMMPVMRELTSVLLPRQPLLGTRGILHVKCTDAVGVTIESMFKLGVEQLDWLIEPDCADMDILAALRAEYPEKLKIHLVQPYQRNYGLLGLPKRNRYVFCVSEGGEILASMARNETPCPDLGIIHTTRGSYEPKKHPDLGIPIIMACNGILKWILDNYHGCGIDSITLLQQEAGLVLPGKTVVVVGAGPVGLGILHYARAAGARTRFCEIDPIKALKSVMMDTLESIALEDAVKQDGTVIVLATGSNTGTVGRPALTKEVLMQVPKGVNVWVMIMGSGQELDLPGLCSISPEIFSESTQRAVTPLDVLEFRTGGVTCFHIKNGGTVHLVGSGRRALNNEHGGHKASTMDAVLTYWLVLPYFHLRHPERVSVGSQDVPEEVERSLCSLVLKCMGVETAASTTEQVEHYGLGFFSELEEARRQYRRI
jgi:S-adenosylhomocysteine hydrolase